MSNTDKLREIKNQVALSKGYPDWKTMENFIIDHNYPVVVAQLLMSAMEDVATLHAQKIADKMVSERDDDVFDKMNCLVGYLERWWKNPQSYPPVELKSVINEAIEYLKSREK